MEVLFISIGRMLSLVPVLDNADPLFALVIAPGFYLHQIEGANQDPASGSLSIASVCLQNLESCILKIDLY